MQIRNVEQTKVKFKVKVKDPKRKVARPGHIYL